MAVHLLNWGIIERNNGPYTAPELATKHLVGIRATDNKPIRTSPIVSFNGREVTTYSGSVYILENVDPQYLNFIQEIGMEFDPENPLKVSSDGYANCCAIKK